MAYRQLTVNDNGGIPFDLASGADILTYTPSDAVATGSVNMVCIAAIEIGHPSVALNQLDGTPGDFTLTVTVGNYVQQPVQQIRFNGAVKAGFPTMAFPAPYNKEVVINLKSPNAADNAVYVKTRLFDAQPLSLPNAVPNNAGGIPVSVAGRTAEDFDNALNTMLEWRNGERLDLLLDTAAAGGGGGSTVNITTEETNIVSENS